jgi:hypothetical protein
MRYSLDSAAMIIEIDSNRYLSGHQAIGVIENLEKAKAMTYYCIY